jgi:hypothetical protein
METHIGFHEVDDVEHWPKPPKRQELFPAVSQAGEAGGNRRLREYVQTQLSGQLQRPDRTVAAARRRPVA